MGFFSSKDKVDVIFCGLDNSGKSTIINYLKPTKLRSDNISATVGYQVEEFEKGQVSFKVYDMGGAKKFRSLWEVYYKDIQGVVFVIDGSDKVRMCLVKDELRMIAENGQMKGIPILFFANKMDIPGARTPQEIVEELELSEMINDRPFNIFASDARRGFGVDEGMDWLKNTVLARKRPQ